MPAYMEPIYVAANNLLKDLQATFSDTDNWLVTIGNEKNILIIWVKNKESKDCLQKIPKYKEWQKFPVHIKLVRYDLNADGRLQSRQVIIDK